MIITLCGSARFEPIFKAWNEALSMSGHAVFSLAAYPSDKQNVKNWYTDEEKKLLDAAHLRKIDASDAIFVINAFAYIGKSTFNEIAYAMYNEKQIIYLESWGQGLGLSSYHSEARRKLALSYGITTPATSPINTYGKYPYDYLCEASPLRSKLANMLSELTS